jgi:hypothetical protein
MDVHHALCWLVMALVVFTFLHSVIFGSREPPWRISDSREIGASILRMKSTFGAQGTDQTLLRVALPPACDGEWLLRPAVTTICSAESLPRVPDLEP